MKLTDKECGIMQCVYCGMSNAEIAKHYKISTSTIKNRITVIMGKIGAKNRWSLAGWWWVYAITGKAQPVYNSDNRVNIAQAGSEAHRARKLKAKGNGVSNKEWKDIKEKYGNKCLKCGSKENISMDHVIPLAKGGEHDVKNIQPLCRHCNSVKNAKHEDYR